MKLKKLLYSGAVIGAVGVATIVPITINASMVNDVSEEVPTEEDNVEQEGVANQCYYDGSPSHNSENACGYITSINHYGKIISTVNVIEAYSNYVSVAIVPNGIYTPAYSQSEGNFTYASSTHNFVADPITAPQTDSWYLVHGGTFLPANTVVNINLLNSSFKPFSGTFVANSPMKNVGLYTNFYFAFTDDNISPTYGTDFTINSLLSGAPGSGKYFYVPGILQPTAKIIFNESNNTYEFNFDYMPATFYLGENSITSSDSATYTFGQDQIWIALWDATTGSYVYDDMFSWGAPVVYENDPEYGSGKKWANLWVGPGMTSTSPGAKYNSSIILGGTSGALYDNMIVNGHMYYMDYTSSDPTPPSSSLVTGWNNPGAYWSTVSFLADPTSYPVSTISTTFSLSDSDNNGIAEGFNVNYSINTGSISRYVYVKIQDQFQNTVFTNDKIVANAGTSNGTITVQTNTPGFGNPSGYGIYAGHTYSVCMSYKIPGANIDCSAVPTGGTTDIYKSSYTMPLFTSTPTTTSGRGYIDLTYKIAFDSKQPAYNYFTYSVWDQTNGRWEVSNQVVDYNEKTTTPQTLRIALNYSTTYDIIINPSPWDGQILNADGTVTDPYANNIVLQDITTLDPMISTTNSIMTTGYSQLNWNYYLNYPSEAITLNMSIYNVGQGPSTGSTPLDTSSVATNGGQTSNVQFDTQLYTLRGGTYEFYAYVDETTGNQSELYHLQVVLDDGLESVDQNSVALSGPTSATVNITWDSEQAGSIYYRTDFNNNGNFEDDQWFHSEDINANSAGVHSITIDHLVSNKANQQVQLSMYPTGLNPTGVAAPNDIVTFTVPQTTSLGMKEYRVSSTKPNDVQFQFKYDTQGSSSYEYVSVYYSDGTGTPAGSPIYTGQMLIEANTNTSTFWLSDTTPYNGSADWTDTTLTPNTSYWLVFSFEDPSGSGNKAKTHFTTD